MFDVNFGQMGCFQVVVDGVDVVIKGGVGGYKQVCQQQGGEDQYWGWYVVIVIEQLDCVQYNYCGNGLVVDGGGGG